MSLVIDRVFFTHEGAAAPLFSDISLHCADGWIGIIGRNGAGKTTLLRLAEGTLSPDSGSVRRPARTAHCPQRTDAPTSGMRRFLESVEGDACRLRGLFVIGEGWLPRWDTLSHGERKRAQVASALWTGPDLLLLDEPTNHIDAGGREQLLAGLRVFRGTGLLVSHDRDLLDALCSHCVFLEPPRLVVRPGGYTAASRAHDDEERFLQEQRERAGSELSRLRAETARRTRGAARADRRRSKRGLARGDHDGRARIDAARVSGADARAGALVRQMEGRLRQAERLVETLGVKKEYALEFRLPGTPSPADRLFFVPPGDLALPDGRVLEHPALCMRGSDRVAVTGANGLGKTTLVSRLLSRLAIDSRRVVYLPQEVGLEASRDLLEQLHSLPRDEQGRVLTIVSALGSRPPQLLATREPSPGEVRKLLLALDAARGPHLIVMDEPTNHLDLPAVGLLEDALAGCSAALLLVSHDARFLRRLATVAWALRPTPRGSRLEIRDVPAARASPSPGRSSS